MPLLVGYKGGALQLASRGTCPALALVAWLATTLCRAPRWAGIGWLGQQLPWCGPHMRDQHIKQMEDGCKVYKESYVASNGSCFKVAWIIFKNHLVEVSLTRAFQNLTTVDSLYFRVMCEDPA